MTEAKINVTGISWSKYVQIPTLNKCSTQVNRIGGTLYKTAESDDDCNANLDWVALTVSLDAGGSRLTTLQFFHLISGLVQCALTDEVEVPI